MRALAVSPGVRGSARLQDVPQPPEGEGAVVVEGLALGICGTDREIVDGQYGQAPPAADHLVIGHESLGRVLEAPSGAGFSRGDLVVGIVRQPDPVPCPNCAVGEWDMCRNGQYTEHGIKGLHGFGRERYRLAPSRAVKVDPSLGALGVLLEPASILAKAWEQVEYIGRRARFAPRRVLVTGAGPIGLLAAMMGKQRGLEVHVMDLANDGPKPTLARDLGASYFVGDTERACMGADVVIECTGVGQVVYDVMRCTPPNAIVCLAGLSSGQRLVEADMTAVNHTMVLENDVVFGSVNANRRHYEAAAAALQSADRGWLGRLVTRRVPLSEWKQAFERQPGDVKTVLDLTA